jgi:Ca-activated chloride channel homolog
MEIRYGKPFPAAEGEGDFQNESGKIDFVDLFSQLFLRSNGDVAQALEWLRKLAESYGLLGRDRTFEDILDELVEKGVITRNQGNFDITPTGDRAIRESVFDRVFKGLGKGLRGSHNTGKLGKGGERQPETRPYSFGDDIADLDFNASFRNTLNRGAEAGLSEDDFEVHEREELAGCATVLMLDISHSMILYGEDRITPAKMVAMSLVEFVRRHYPRDTIDVITFGDEAKQIAPNRIAHVAIGPFHTNTCDGLKLAQTLLRRRKSPNKQIFMVTDGKPSAVFDRGRLYKNSMGLDPLVLQKTFAEGRNCRKSKIRVCTFMIAQDPYLIEFVQEFTLVSGGQAFYTGLDGLGEFVFVDYQAHRRGKIR